jgi:hypothetical protein
VQETRIVRTEAAQGAIAVGRGAAAPESSHSAVAWAAIIGGAVAAIATTVVLMALGAGLGLTTVSPWQNFGAAATTFGIAAAVWIVVTQWLAAGLGGYLTGRLRAKWTAMHDDEVFFRDTAHGFLAWAAATLIVVAFLASAGSAVVRGTASAVSGAASAATQVAGQAAAGDTNPSAYLTDTLFRSGTAAASGQDPRPEATRILATGLRTGQLAPDDRTYLAQLVATRTGISQPEAEQRVDAVFAQLKDAEAKARQAADTARKTAASISIITALALVIGAFVASAAAALGGRQRDAY